MEGRETTEGVDKVAQVRDDVEVERHWGGLGAVNWIWGLMQRWRGLENVSQVFGLLNNAINGHRTLQKEAWIWGILNIKWKQNPITKHLGGDESEVCESVKVAQLHPTLCDPMDYIVHGTFQAIKLEWVAFPFSRASSQPRDFFFMWTNFKVFIDCVTMLFLSFFFFKFFDRHQVGS